MTNSRSALLLVLLILAVSCTRKLPEKTYPAFSFNLQLDAQIDTVWILATNPLACPVSLTLRSDIQVVDRQLEPYKNHIIGPNEEFRIPISTDQPEELIRSSLVFRPFWAAKFPVQTDTTAIYQFPFKRGKNYSIIQGYDGKYTHNTDFSRYAIDFKVPVGDTICAARDGVVVGVVQDNKNWMHGTNSSYRDYANYLRLFHADQTYTDYVHLKNKGVLVAMGDTVRAGQPIAISGFTGWTTTPHLHFNVFKPSPGRNYMIGVPVQFEKIPGAELRKGMMVGH